MADIKKYYYLKLKENFYDSDAMILLENMENGYLYSNILMKMYLRSLKSNGRLMFNDRIPYNAQMLSKIVGHNKDVVEKAINIFKELDLIDILDNGAIYMLDIQNYIGKSSDDADRKRAYREEINNEKNKIRQMSGQMSTKCLDKSPLEIDIDKEIDIDIDKDIYIEKDKEKDIDNTLYDLIENNFNRTLNSIEYEYISKWEDNELTRYVIKETIAKNICNVKYIDTTLNNYKSRNITTVQQAQEEEQLFQKKRNEYNQKKYFNANERASMSLDEFVRRGEEEENKTK